MNNNRNTSLTLKNIPLPLHSRIKKIQLERMESGEKITLEAIYLELTMRGLASIKKE